MADSGEVTPDYFLQRKYTTAEELESVLQDIRVRYGKPSEYASELAIGVYTDDIDGADPATFDSTDMEAGMVVVIHQGKIRGIAISDEYLDGSFTPDEFTVLFNAVMQNAYAVWAEVYHRLYTSGVEMIEQMGLEDAAEVMDEEIEDARSS